MEMKNADTCQKYSLTKVIQVLSAMATFLAGLEVGLIFALNVCPLDARKV
jgi:hypothetical protein